MKNYRKLIAFCLSLTLVTSVSGIPAIAKENTDAKTETSEKAESHENEPYKEETVYVLCNNDSSIKSVYSLVNQKIYSMKTIDYKENATLYSYCNLHSLWTNKVEK